MTGFNSLFSSHCISCLSEDRYNTSSNICSSSGLGSFHPSNHKKVASAASFWVDSLPSLKPSSTRFSSHSCTKMPSSSGNKPHCEYSPYNERFSSTGDTRSFIHRHCSNEHDVKINHLMQFFVGEYYGTAKLSLRSRKRVLMKHVRSSLNKNQMHAKQTPVAGISSRIQSPKVPIFVMLPLDSVSIVNTISHPRALNAGLKALRSVGVEGVMVDVWWGIVESDGPKLYDWSAYKALFKMIQSAGLKIQAIMSFHGCGGNVGDNCLVSLPFWVLEVADVNPDVFYTDRAGVRNGEYLSLGVDLIPLFHGRSPLQMYSDFISSFRETFEGLFKETIVEVSVGLGPAGELRYPSYPEGDGRWKYPGIGEFQCYDKYMLSNLQACAESLGKPRWALEGGPHDAGDYNQNPNDTGFFHPFHGSWNSSYGDFFLTWYSQSLVNHGDRILSCARNILEGTGVTVAGKLAGVHWWYKTRSHAAELTAGYYNTFSRDGYDAIAKMFDKNNALLNFTCVEMGDDEQPLEAFCSPESLMFQVRSSCAKYEVPVSGENALPRFDRKAYSRIITNVYKHEHPWLPQMATFTFLRMGESLFQAENWRLFVDFVRYMEHPNEKGDSNSRPHPTLNTHECYTNALSVISS